MRSLWPGRSNRSGLARLVDGTEIVRYLNGEVIVAAPTPAQAAPLSGEYRELVQRKLAAAMNRSVRFGVVVQGGQGDEDEVSDTRPWSGRDRSNHGAKTRFRHSG